MINSSFSFKIYLFHYWILTSFSLPFIDPNFEFSNTSMKIQKWHLSYMTFRSNFQTFGFVVTANLCMYSYVHTCANARMHCLLFGGRNIFIRNYSPSKCRISFEHTLWPNRKKLIYRSLVDFHINVYVYNIG